MTFSLLDFSFTTVQNLTKSAQLLFFWCFFFFFKIIEAFQCSLWEIPFSSQKLEPEEPRPFPTAMQDNNAQPKEAEQAISIPPFHREQIKARLSAPVIVLERNAKAKDMRKTDTKNQNCLYHSSLKTSWAEFFLCNASLQRKKALAGAWATTESFIRLPSIIFCGFLWDASDPGDSLYC